MDTEQIETLSLEYISAEHAANAAGQALMDYCFPLVREAIAKKEYDEAINIARLCVYPVGFAFMMDVIRVARGDYETKN